MTPAKFPFLRPSLSLLVALLAACSQVAPTNPYDPATPVTRQAPASVVGHVVLHERGATAVGVQVRLLDREGKPVLDDNGQPRAAALTAEAGNGEAMGLGQFQLGGIQPGSYHLTVDVDSRFASPVIPEFTLGPGEVHSVGTLVYERQDVGTGRIHGEVALKDALGGPRTVSLYRKIGSGNELVRQVRTDGDGKFDLDLLPPGSYALSAELTGFTPAYTLGLTLAETPGGLGENDVALEGDKRLVLHPVTAVLVPSLARQFGQFYTNSDRLPLLVLAFGGMSEMRLSTDPAFLDQDGHEIDYVPYNATAEVGLPSTEGPIEIYGQFRMRGDGFEFTSDVYRTTVIRDVTPPKVVGLGARGVLPDSGGITWLREEGASLTLEIQGNDTSSAVAAYGVYHDAANDEGTPDVVAFHVVDAPPGYVRLDQQVTLMPGQGPKVVAVYLKDRAGNVSPPVKLEVIVDSVPPALAEGESIVAVNANQQKQLDSRLAQLRVRVPDECRGTPTAPEGECALDFRAGQQPMPAVGLFSPFALSADDTVTVPVNGANGQSVGFEVQLRDRAGNVANYQSELYVLKLVGTLSGRVLVDGYADDAPAHGGISVSLFNPGPDRTQPVAIATTAADGSFTLKTATEDPNLASTRIPAGHYIVVTNRADLQPFEAETDVRENENAVLPAYRVTPARGNITGRFIRADRKSSPSAHGGIEVSALRGGVLVAKTQTSDDGTFIFPAPGVPVTVEADRYTLVAAASGYASRKVEGIEVTASQTTIVDSDGATPPSPKPQELSRLSGDFAFCESLTGDCIPTLYTNQRTVRIKLLDATGVTEIRLQGRTAFEADADDPPWQAFSSNGVYTTTIAGATDPEGAIDVFVQTKVSGTVGPVLSASIIYDQTPPAITSFQLLPGTNALDGFTNEPAVRAKVSADPGTGKVAPLQGAQVVFAATKPATVPSSATACIFDATCSVSLPKVSGVIAEQTYTAYAFACDQAKNCSTAPSSARIVYDATAPKTQNGVAFQPQATWITKADGNWYTRTSRVDVQLGVGTAKTGSGTAVTDLAGNPVVDVVRYRFGLQQDLSDAGWNAVPPSVQPSASFSASGPALTGEDGKYRIYAQFMDAAGNATDVDNNPRNFDITLDRLPPAVAFGLNGGAAWTTNPTVTLDVTNAAGDPGPAREVWLSLDGGLFNTYDRRVLPLVGSATTFTLPSSDGSYVVYARFIDAAGNVSDRPATIFLDRTKPSILSLGCGTCRVDAATGTIYSNATSRQAVIDLVAVDNSGQIASIQTKIDNAPPASGQYVGNFTATFPDQDGPHTITVTATDPAGNVSATQTLTVVLDRTQPDAGVFVNSDATYATNASVVVSVDNHDGAPIAGIRLSNTATFSGPVAPFATTSPWTLASPSVDGLRTVYVELTDPAGNTTTASDSIILDTHAPTAPTLTLTAPATTGPGNAISTPTVTLAIASTDAAGSLATGAVQISGDIAATGGSTGWLASGATGLTFANGTFTWTGDLASGDGAKSVSVKVRDAAGNVSDATIIRFQLQTTAPGSTTATLTPATYATSTAANLKLTAVGASQVKVSGDVAAVDGLPANVGNYIAYASALPITLTSGDGLKTVTVTFRNDAGLTATPITLTTTLDTTAPTGTLAISGTVADGAASTTLTGTAQVLLKTTSTDATSGVSLMRFGNTLSELASASWRAAADTVPWTLPGADGTKTVYMQLADGAGNTSPATSSVISSAIVLDTQAPTTPVITVTTPATMGAGNAISSATGLVLGIATTDTAGSLSTGRVRLDGDVSVTGGAATTGWVAVGSSGIALAAGGFTWSGDLVTGDGAKAVTATIRDAAGNVSGPATVRFNLQSQPPANPSVSLAAAPYAASTATTLALAAVGASQVRVAGDLASVNGLPANVGNWIAYATSLPIVLTAGDGLKNVDVTFRNDAGVATATIRVTTTLDLTAPTGTLAVSGTVANGATSTSLTGTAKVQLDINAVDGGSGATQLRVADSIGTLASAAWQPVSAHVPWTLPAGDGAKTVYLQLQDAAGNRSSASTPISASTVLDTTAPTAPVITVTSPTLGTGNALSTANVTLQLASTDGAGSLATGAVLLQGDVTSGGSWLTNGAGATFSSGAFTWSGSLTSGDGAKSVIVTVRDAAGNTSASGTVRFNLQTTAPTNGSVAISPSPATNATSATLSLSASGASQVMISGDLASVNGLPGNVGTYIAYATSVPVVLTSGDGLKTVNVTFRNDAGLASAAYTVKTTLDTTAPTGTLGIIGPVADGATSTSLTGSAQVTLALTTSDGAGTGVTQMRVANASGALSSATWQPVPTTLPWSLAAGDGAKTVYLQLQDSAGNVSSVATPISATTTLDTTPPTTPNLTVTSPATLGTGNALSTPSITLSISSSDTAGSLSTGKVMVQGDISSASTGWLAAGAGGLTFSAGTFSWSGTLSSGDGLKTVNVTVRDAAGNVSQVGTIRFNLQTTAPTNATASVAPAPYTASTSATLTLAATGASQVRISGDLASVNGLPANVGAYVAYAQSVPVVLTSGDGTKNLTVTFKNDAGLTTAPISLVTKLDTTPPTGSFTIIGPVDLGQTSTSRTGARAVTLSITSSDALSGVSQMRVADTLGALSATTYGAVQNTMAWTLPAGDGTKTVYIQLKDAVGNESTAQNASTTLDLTAPSAPRFTAQPTATNATAITLDLATTSSDALSGPVRYELLTPAATAWTTATFPTSFTLATDKTSTFQVRAVDQAGNVSAADSFTITQDSQSPPTPVIVTPRAYVNATTTSVSLTGSDQDASFLRYETCTANVAVGATCPGTCSFAASSASFALSLTSGQRTCVLARAVDKGGNTSGVASASVVSDLTLPVAPGIAPQFSPSVLSVRATEIELFATSAATDLPLGGPSAPWRGVAYLEVNTGAGYQALCPGYLNVANEWDPCNPSNRCTDSRLRCMDGAVDGFMLPLLEGAQNTLSVRAVDLAGNIGDGASVTVNTDSPRQVTFGTGSESDAMLFGNLVAHTNYTGSATYAQILNLGPNRIFEPLYPVYDSTCYVDSSFTSSSYARIGNQGVTFSSYSSSTGITAASFKGNGADGQPCTYDEPATITLGTVPGGSDLMTLGTAGKYAAWAIGSYSGCAPVNVRQAGSNGVLGDGDDTTVALAYQVRSRNGWRGSGPEPMQLTPRNMLVLGNCPNYNGSFTVIQPSSAGYTSYSTYTIPSATNAVLSQDGLTLAYVYNQALYVRQAGADGLFGTADDVAANRSMLLDEYFAYYQLAADATRVVAIDQDSSGRQESNLRIHSWSAGPDGRFDTSATADDVFREGYLGTLNRTTPSLSAGLLVYEQNGNLYSIDYSTARWEAVRSAKTAYPTDNGAGITFYVDVGAGYSGSQALHARTAAGNETTVPPNTFGMDTIDRAFATDGNNLVLATFDLYNTSNFSLIAWAPGSDGQWFTADDATKTLASATGSWVYNPLAAGGGKAALYNSAAGTLQVVDPGVTNGSWTGAASKLVTIASISATGYAGVSARYVTWVSGGNVWIKYTGADGLFGTFDDGAATTLKQYPSSPATPYSTYYGDVQLAGNRLAFHEAYGTTTLTVVDAGADRLFNTSDDVVLHPTLRPPTWGCSEPECNFTINGDFVGFTDTDSNGNSQAYVIDLRSNNRVQVSYTASVKTNAQITGGGRLLWEDSIFSIPSVFSWAP